MSAVGFCFDGHHSLYRPVSSTVFRTNGNQRRHILQCVLHIFQTAVVHIRNANSDQMLLPGENMEDRRIFFFFK